MAVGEAGVVEPEQVQGGGLEIMHMHRLLHRLEAEFIGGAIDRAPLHATASQPHREPMVVVVAT